MKLDGSLPIKICFLPKTKMVRMVHTNHFYEILAQISDPKIEFLTKTHFLKNDHVQNFRTCDSGQKKPCGVVPQQNKGCKHIPDHSRPNSDQIISQNSYFYSKFIENRRFSIKITKRFKIVAKAWPRQSLLKKSSSACCIVWDRSSTVPRYV